jgi:CheY-like chemotaxis protein
MRILLAEDDAMIGEVVRDALRAEGHAADWVRDGAQAGTALANPRTTWCCWTWACRAVQAGGAARPARARPAPAGADRHRARRGGRA